MGLGPVESMHQSSMSPLDFAPVTSHSRRPNVPISVTFCLSSSMPMFWYSVRWSLTVKQGDFTPEASYVHVALLLASRGMFSTSFEAVGSLPTRPSAIVYTAS